MRTTPIGIIMINDEREHVYTQNNEENIRVVKQWAEIISENVVNIDGSRPEIIIGSEIQDFLALQIGTKDIPGVKSGMGRVVKKPDAVKRSFLERVNLSQDFN